MNCCPYTTQNFVNQSVTIIPVAGVQSVEVFYLNGDGSWTAAGTLTRIEIYPGSVVVDHGGPATGTIKLIT